MFDPDKILRPLLGGLAELMQRKICLAMHILYLVGCTALTPPDFPARNFFTAYFISGIVMTWGKRTVSALINSYNVPFLWTVPLTVIQWDHYSHYYKVANKKLFSYDV